jgi:ribose transport system permease protein
MAHPTLAKIAARARPALFLVLLAAVLGLASPRFATADNLLAVFQQSSLNALLALGMTFVILSGGIDLSVGSLLALCGVVVADLVVHGVPIPVALVAGVALGAGCGAINGLVVVAARIPPFIATLGMMLVARSAAKIYTGTVPISGLPDGFRALSGTVLGVPTLGVLVVAFYLAARFVLDRTRLGRYAYALGGNEQAAWLSGVPTGAYRVALYAISGAMAGVTGVLLASRNNAGMPLAGDMYEL